MDVATKGHTRSKSDSAMKRGWEDKFSYILEASHRLKLDMGELKSCVKVKKRQSLSTEVQNSLKQEILQLQKQLEDQFVVRSALERALTFRPLSHEPTNEKPITKPAKDLIKEIAILEMEVVNMEKYLLSLYQKTFEERVPFLSELYGKSKPISATHKRMSSEDSGHDVTPKFESSAMNSNFFNPAKESGHVSGAKTLLDSSIHRSNSSLSHRSASFRTQMGSIKEAILSYHSVPFSMLEHNGDEDHLGTSIPDHILKQPNWLSEEMIKCITAIYIELAEPPLINQCFPSSPFSFSSSISDSSLSTEGRKISACPPWMDNPFNIEGSKELGGSYRTMVEVPWICRDSQRLTRVKDMLQSFRSLIYWLEEIDPEKMKHDEKLAFWINVHNALVMHAFLVYGIPQNNLKRISLLLKAAYNVGGHTISVNMIQNSILGCRLPRPGQWLQSLFFPRTKFKVGDARKAFEIDNLEPRLYFALCSGSRSDPVVRMYTPKSVFQDLEAAKEDYIHTTFKIQKEQKILLPKIIHTFMKESGLCPAGFVELIEDLMPDFFRKRVENHQHGKFWKRIEWIPHNFAFRYLLSKELAK